MHAGRGRAVYLSLQMVTSGVGFCKITVLVSFMPHIATGEGFSELRENHGEIQETIQNFCKESKLTQSKHKDKILQLQQQEHVEIPPPPDFAVSQASSVSLLSRGRFVKAQTSQPVEIGLVRCCGTISH